MSEISERPIAKELTDCLHWWNRAANILRALWVILAILSILCSVLVGGSSATSIATSGSTGSASKFGFLEAWQVAVLSIISAMAVGIMSALDIRGNADRTRKAWRMLNSAVIDYKTESHYKIEQLNKVYKAAEAVFENRG
jgi:hypothetical protein